VLSSAVEHETREQNPEGVALQLAQDAAERSPGYSGNSYPSPVGAAPFSHRLFSHRKTLRGIGHSKPNLAA